MSATYSEDYRRKIVSNYQQLWQEQSLSIDQYATQICINHTTVRKWLKQYAPEFEERRRGQQSKFRNRRSLDHPDPDPIAELEEEPSSQCKSQSVTVQTEWYQEEPEHELDPHQDDLVQQLREEIVFLKQQVSYWMRQEAIPA